MSSGSKADFPVLVVPMERYSSKMLTVVFLWFAGGSALAAHAPTIPASAAAQTFSKADELCTAEGGELWGHSLCGPMILVDQASREAVFSEPVPGAIREGAIWRNTLPENIPIGNSAVAYNGQRWTMLLWPLPEDRAGIILMHESFHRIQPALGFASGASMAAANGHLDTHQGRIWFRAELHALRAALKHTDKERDRALTDALVARVYRRSLWPQAAEQERELEFAEGLAQSTGIDAALPSPDARIKAAIEDIAIIEDVASYVRSFAYATGPAYGELLNAADPDWRRRIKPSFDFGIATAKAYNIPLPSADKEAAMRALCRHDGKTILGQEDRRAGKMKARNMRYEELFISGPTVTFSLHNTSSSFDPRQITQFGDHGRVYKVLHINDVWGELSVKNGDGALTTPEFDHVVVPVTQKLTGDHLSGEGWSATLKETYGLAPDPHKPGSWVVAKETGLH